MTDNHERANPEGGEGAGEKPAEAAGAEATAPASPEERIAQLEAERNDARERMLRIAAEFDNYKKRVRREQADADAKTKENILRDVLEVVDNLDRAAAVDEKADVKSLQQGISLVSRLFQQKLERHDVRPFDAKGQAFDPRIHDAISQLPTADAPPGSVVSEVQKGYRMGERLLRPAMVVVAVAPPAQAAADKTDNGAGKGGAGSD
jgi:molecular chaperone GrpE